MKKDVVNEAERLTLDKPFFNAIIIVRKLKYGKVLKRRVEWERFQREMRMLEVS